MKDIVSRLQLFVLVLLLAGCAALTTRPEPPRVSLAGLRLLSVDLFEQRYQVRLRVKNPNSVALPVRGMDFRLEVNGQAFADGVSSQPVDVPAFGEQVISLEVTSSLLQVFRQLQSLEDSRSPGFTYKLDGSVAVGDSLVRLPFEHSGELKLSEPPTATEKPVR